MEGRAEIELRAPLLNLVVNCREPARPPPSPSERFAAVRSRTISRSIQSSESNTATLQLCLPYTSHGSSKWYKEANDAAQEDN